MSRHLRIQSISCVNLLASVLYDGWNANRYRIICCSLFFLADFLELRGLIVRFVLVRLNTLVKKGTWIKCDVNESGGGADISVVKSPVASSPATSSLRSRNSFSGRFLISKAIVSGSTISFSLRLPSSSVGGNVITGLVADGSDADAIFPVIPLEIVGVVKYSPFARNPFSSASYVTLKKGKIVN